MEKKSRGPLYIILALAAVLGMVIFEIFKIVGTLA